MFSCMVKYAEDTRRTLLLGRFESKHYKRRTDMDAGLPYMDEIIDLDRLYNGDIWQVRRAYGMNARRNVAGC